MSIEFIKLISISTIIAFPVGIATGLYMNSYLVFNIGRSYFNMAFLLLLVIGIASGAVGYFSWSAAQANPAKTLKTE